MPTIRFIGLYPSTKRTALQYASLTGGRLPGPLIIRGPTEIRSCHQLVTCGGGVILILSHSGSRKRQKDGADHRSPSSITLEVTPESKTLGRLRSYGGQKPLETHHRDSDSEAASSQVSQVKCITISVL